MFSLLFCFDVGFIYVHRHTNLPTPEKSAEVASVIEICIIATPDIKDGHKRLAV